ncbi:hypothetical protein DFH08DRAFT_655439, partial [Mycena albidolilacea]
LACPASAPAWFVDARGDITREGLGPHYDAVIAAWTRMEQASRFEQGPTNLSSKGCPKQVGAWITNARGKRGTTPAVPDPAMYAVEWQGWWDSLQPEWRRKEGDGRWSVTEGYGEGGREWGLLYHWGINGVLSVVASLYFWGCAVRGGDPVLQASWEAAVGDVGWMLE